VVGDGECRRRGLEHSWRSPERSRENGPRSSPPTGGGSVEGFWSSINPACREKRISQSSSCCCSIRACTRRRRRRDSLPSPRLRFTIACAGFNRLRKTLLRKVELSRRGSSRTLRSSFPRSNASDPQFRVRRFPDSRRHRPLKTSRITVFIPAWHPRRMCSSRHRRARVPQAPSKPSSLTDWLCSLQIHQVSVTRAAS